MPASNVLQLPRAASAPVSNPARRGRYPQGVRSLTTYRLSKATAAMLVKAQSLKVVQSIAEDEAGSGGENGAKGVPLSLAHQISAMRFNCGMLLMLAQTAVKDMEALCGAEVAEEL